MMIYRAATREDAGAIARGIEQASDGLVAFLLHDLAGDCSPADLLRTEVERADTVDSYCNTDVVTENGQIIAIAVSLPASEPKISADMENAIAPDRLNVVRELYQNLVEGSWLLDTLWVDASFRRQGIGSRLIDQTKAKAREKGFPSLSLATWADNDRAIRLYKRQGFQPVKIVEIPPHPQLPHSQGFLLMNYPLEP